MSTLTKKLLKSLQASLLGLSDAKKFEVRLSEFECEAEKQIPDSIGDANKKLELTELWMRYKYYSDAVDYHLASAENVDVDAEGSVDFGDWSARHKALERSRDKAKADFDNGVATPEVVVSVHQEHSFFMDTETSF